MKPYLLLFAVAPALAAADLTLWYDAPAMYEAKRPGLDQAIPIGNGTQGSLVFGGVAGDRMVINDISLWTGDENPSGGYYAKGTMGNYRTGGEIGLDFTGQDQPTGYRRQLDLQTAIATVTYQVGPTTFTREHFASHPAKVQVARYTASTPGALSGTLWLKDGNGGTVTASADGIAADGTLANGLVFATRMRLVPEGGTLTVDGPALRFANCNALTLVYGIGTDYVMDGTRTWKGDAPGPRLMAAVAAAAAKPVDELRTAHVAEYRSWFDRVRLDLGAPTAAQAAMTTDKRTVAAATSDDPSFAALKFQHGRYLLISCSRPGGLPANLQGLWNDINNPAWCSDYHTNINIQMNYWLAEVANLSECHLPLFDLIESQLPEWRKATAADPIFSLPGKPAQGWTVRTSHNTRGGMGWRWDNTSNAWYALHFWEHFAFTGDRDFLAKRAYPILKEVTEFWDNRLKRLPDGSLVVPNGWSPEHGPENVDGTAYCQQIIYDLFSNYLDAADALGIDKDYRNRVAELRAALAGPKVGHWGQLLEWAQELTAIHFDPKTDFKKGKTAKDASQLDQAYERLASKEPMAAMIVAQTPSELLAGLADPGKRSREALCQILNRVVDGPSLLNHPAFANTAAWSRLDAIKARVGSDPSLVPLLNRLILIRGLGFQVETLDSPTDGHRHTSHLFAVYPGRQISRERTPVWAEAAKVSLDGRGPGGATEWSAAWRCNLFARLRDGENARAMLQLFHRLSTPNLFGNHPPMQIDGALGITAGMAEMLLQSHAGTVELLPALPKAWANGTVSGLKARGGLTVDMSWKEGTLVEAVLHPTATAPVTVRAGGRTVTVTTTPGQAVRLDAALNH